MYSTVNHTAPPGTAWAHSAWGGEWAMVLCPAIYGAGKEHKYKVHPVCEEVYGGATQTILRLCSGWTAATVGMKTNNFWGIWTKKRSNQSGISPTGRVLEIPPSPSSSSQRLFPGQLGSLSISKTQTQCLGKVSTLWSGYSNKLCDFMWQTNTRTSYLFKNQIYNDMH